MLKLTIAAAAVLALGLTAAAAPAGAQTAPPAKVCKNMLGKVVPCKPAPGAKPATAAKPATPAKPGLLSHLAPKPSAAPAAAPQHPASAAPATSATAAAAKPGAATGGASQSSPLNATARCNDGSYWRSKSHAGSCAHHGGVMKFYK
jgi:hypothetical protein